jgi:HAMP domain-containing protein
VLIEADLNHMWRDIGRHVGAIGGATLLSFLIAVPRAAKSVIAEPITKLIDTAQKVSSSQTYSHRIAHQRSDELGVLIDSFNDMLAQIDSRDSAWPITATSSSARWACARRSWKRPRMRPRRPARRRAPSSPP